MLATLRIQNQLRWESYVSLEAGHLPPISWMCKKQTSVSHSSTESEIISLDAALRMDGLFAFDHWDVVIAGVRLTNNTKRPIRQASGNWCGTGNHSSNKTMSKTPTERSNRDVDQLSNVDHVLTNTHASQGESQLYIFEDNEAVIKMIIKRRNPTMRHVSRTQRVALDWLIDRVNLEPQIQLKLCWYQKPTRRRADQRGVSRVMSGIIFFVCSTLRIFRCPLAAIRVPCQREDKKRLPVKVHRWQKQSQCIRQWRSRDPGTWCCTTR